MGNKMPTMIDDRLRDPVDIKKSAIPYTLSDVFDVFQVSISSTRLDHNSKIASIEGGPHLSWSTLFCLLFARISNL